MKKIFFIMFVFNGLFFVLNALDLNNKIVVSIPKQNSEVLKIPALNLKVGESGIIVREIDSNEFILGNAIVYAINDSVASIKFSEFSMLNQKYMPKPIGVPKENDKIIFRIFYDRGLIIAPNQNAYQQILDENKNIDFVHPDVFASYLANVDENMPSKNDFRGFCDKFDVGLVFMTIKDSLLVLDCQSFGMISNVDFILRDSETKLPFFTRISDGGLDKLFSMKKMQDYFIYYSKLVESNNIDFKVK